MSERNEAERNGSAVTAQSTYLNKGNLMFDVNECERCACEVESSQSLCRECTVSVPMFEQSTSRQTILDMLVELEEKQLFTTV